MKLPKAIICEIDVVLASNRHRLHFIDYSLAMERDVSLEECQSWEADYDSYHREIDKDGYNGPIIQILERSPAQTIIITSRPEKHRIATQGWIGPLMFKTELFMRPDFIWAQLIIPEMPLPSTVDGSIRNCAGTIFERRPDDRPSHIVKEEIYEREVAGKYDVLFVLEREGDCAEMYRELGLTVLGVKQCN